MPTTINLENVLMRGLRSAQPAAGVTAEGTLYFVTDEGVTEQVRSAAWVTYSNTVATIGSGQIVSGNIASGQVGSFHLSSGCIISGRISSGVIGSFHIASGGVLSGNIASGQVGSFHLSSGCVVSGRIASGQIGANHLASGVLSTGGTSLPLIILQDQKTLNTGGGSFTTGAWRTRDLNTEVVDTGNNCLLSGNRFALADGVYRIRAAAPAYFTNRHKCKLYNAGGAADVLIGSSEYAAAATIQTISVIEGGRFTVASSGTAYEIQHECETTSNTLGFGVPSNFSGSVEVYTQVVLEKES